MPQQRFLTPDRLYDRPFSATGGRPFNRRPSGLRRWGMLALFVFLCSIIGGYLFVTDSNRVRRLAESELTKLIGGHITVGRAKLSIFEGLKLELVNLYVDRGGATDSVVFSANQFLVNYDPRALLVGRLKLTQIIAIDPHVQLSEDLDTGKWNYQRLERPVPTTTAPTKPGPLPSLPEVILRNAKIDYAAVSSRPGQSGSRGTLTIEGQFAPSSDGMSYTFEMQSRGGGSDGQVNLGPTITGSLRRDTGKITAALHDFQFGQDIRSMLPAQVRDWWDRHALAGAVDVPLLSYTPATRSDDAHYRVVTQLRGVNMLVRPEEWMSRDELQTQQWASDAFDVMRLAGLNAHGVVDRLSELIDPSPVQLKNAEGRFEFTENGITLGEYDERGALVASVHGTVEGNKFGIDGRIEGYSPQAPATIRVGSEHVEIPTTPRYITSMPRQVRELYDHLRPSGVCTMQVSVERPTLGSRMEIAGKVHILDGRFVFDRFPYPVRAASGDIIFGYDYASQMDRVKLALEGKGAAGGPNRRSTIRLSGLIAPLTSDVGVHVDVTCDDVRDEPLLYDSFPPEVRTALKNLDADGRGEYPKYRGSFECRVDRAIGPRSPWLVETDVVLKDAAGKMVAFPYFMEHVTGRLEVREGYVDIINASMKRGDASLAIDGRVTWRAGVGGKALEPGETQNQVTKPRPDLKITARNVPLDQNLLDALPEDRRQWLEKVGLTGVLDIDGRVWRPSAAELSSTAKITSDSELTHAFDIAMRDGKLWPTEKGAYAVSGLSARLHLLPDGMQVNDLHAKRGEGDLVGRGEVNWPHNKPNIFFSGTATQLALDSTLYKVLPLVAKQGWDAVHPEGVVDLDMTYHGGVGVDAKASSVEASVAEMPIQNPQSRVQNASSDFDLIIHPRQLAATVQAVPYRLTDINGTVRVNNGHVTLTDLSAKHGKATVRVAGSGNVASDASDWDLRLAADGCPVDAEFRKALPSGLASLVDSLKLNGVVSFDFAKLGVRTLPAGAMSTATKVNTTNPDSHPVDVDFGVKLSLSDGSMDVGVPFAKVKGNLALEGTVRNSKLAALSGPLDLSELTIASRDASDVHAEFYKPADQDALRIGRINGKLAGGEVAGQVDLAFPDVGPSRYVMNLVLRNADVKDLTGDSAPDLSGELSASLALEGDWTNSNTRRGRGDVAVAGRQMYKIPLVLGLLQVTNLSLPITSPFNEGSARYTVEGPTVTFDSLELRSKNMLMSGSGQLNFNTKKVAMTFTTDNPNWPKLPIIGDIVQTAKHELLQIHVKGTLEESKPTTTNPTNTSSTTVDEVTSGGEKK